MQLLDIFRNFYSLTILGYRAMITTENFDIEEKLFKFSV